MGAGVITTVKGIRVYYIDTKMHYKINKVTIGSIK